TASKTADRVLTTRESVFLDLTQSFVIAAWLTLPAGGILPMRIPFRGVMISGVTAVVVSALWIALTPVVGQERAGRFPAYRPVRMADGHPDLNGMWQAFVTANWDLQDHEAQAGPHPELMGAYGAEPAGQSIVEGGEIPYQPWALAKKKDNFEKRMRADVSNDKKWHELGDPEFKCYMPGVPRAT